jgi:hypothetical protein
LWTSAVLLVAQPLASVVRRCACLQNGIGDHFTRNQIGADAEMFERPLSLSTPELVLRYFNGSEAVGLFRTLLIAVSPWISGDDSLG